MLCTKGGKFKFFYREKIYSSPDANSLYCVVRIEYTLEIQDEFNFCCYTICCLNYTICYSTKASKDKFQNQLKKVEKKIIKKEI